MKKHLFGHEALDRDRGVLTPADREFLRTEGKNLGSEQSRRNTRRRIRKRIRNAIIDFDLIVRLLNDEDRALVFEEEEDHWDRVFQAGQKAMIEFLYAGLADADETTMDFETVLKSGVHDAELERHDGPVFVDVDFGVETDVQFDLEDARERFENGSALTVAEIGALIATGTVDDPDQMAELAELAQERGVVESSVSPMQAAYAAEALDIDPVGSEGVPVLATDDDETADAIDIITRGEPLMLLNAFEKTDEVDADTDEGEDVAPVEPSD
ncbi:hypothetical protein [Halorubrum tropicale]|uniref:hypothetical protein n=1 Tax=Halorubrum tropicale TaxID=1765655 RepID=UPI0006B20D7B|nr:hypothetical protein [Halorubrum tropicale]